MASLWMRRLWLSDARTFGLYGRWSGTECCRNISGSAAFHLPMKSRGPKPIRQRLEVVKGPSPALQKPKRVSKEEIEMKRLKGSSTPTKPPLDNASLKYLKVAARGNLKNDIRRKSAEKATQKPTAAAGAEKPKGKSRNLDGSEIREVSSHLPGIFHCQ